MEDIKLKDNNLFINGVVEDYGGDEQVLYRDKLTIVGNSLDKYHTVVYSDRLDKLAYRYYKNVSDDPSKLWWVIADANGIHNPLDLSTFVGKEILIPDWPRVRTLVWDLE